MTDSVWGEPDPDFEEQTDPIQRVRRRANRADAEANIQSEPAAFAPPQQPDTDTDGLSVQDAYEAGYEGITLFAEASKYELAADAASEIEGARVAAVSVRHPVQAQDLSAPAAHSSILLEDTSTAPHWINAEIARSTILATPLAPEDHFSRSGNFVQTQEFAPIHLPPPPKNRFFGSISLVLGIVSLIAALFTPWLFFFGSISMVLGSIALVAKRQISQASWGVGLSFLSGIFALIWLFWMFVHPLL